MSCESEYGTDPAAQLQVQSDSLPLAAFFTCEQRIPGCTIAISWGPKNQPAGKGQADIEPQNDELHFRVSNHSMSPLCVELYTPTSTPSSIDPHVRQKPTY
jgi:hypothetical protein